MTDMSSAGMVSYYNPLTMYRQQQPAAAGATQLSQHAQHVHNVHQHSQQHSMVTAAAVVAAASGAPPPDSTQQYWYGYSHAHSAHHAHSGHHHHHHHHQSSPPTSQQYLDHADVLAGWPPHPHAHPYTHFQYHHQAAYQQQQQQQQQQLLQNEWSGDEGNNPAIGSSEPSPPITVSSISEVSSPITPSSSPSNNNNNSNSNNNNNNNNAPNNNSGNATTPSRPQTIRSPYEWMKKPSYQTQPNPACNIAGINSCSVPVLPDICTLDGKTRTKDKYRVVYTDHQRLELEKEFHYSRYITIRRKSELAANLSLSERQVKIWFQNRRAKERKQVKKREELEHKDMKTGEGLSAGSMASLAALSGMSGMLGGLIHGGGSPPLNLGPPSHGLTLSHPASTLHPHAHQHAPHPHTVIGL